jgi:hypothetical protein
MTARQGRSRGKWFESFVSCNLRTRRVLQLNDLYRGFEVDVRDKPSHADQPLKSSDDSRLLESVRLEPHESCRVAFNCRKILTQLGRTWID